MRQNKWDAAGSDELSPPCDELSPPREELSPRRNMHNPIAMLFPFIAPNETKMEFSM